MKQSFHRRVCWIWIITLYLVFLLSSLRRGSIRWTLGRLQLHSTLNPPPQLLSSIHLVLLDFKCFRSKFRGSEIRAIPTVMILKSSVIESLCPSVSMSVTCHMSHFTCHVSCVMCHMSCFTCHVSCVKCHKKNPAYGRHWISRPMRIIGPIFFLGGGIVKKKNNNKKKTKKQKTKKMEKVVELVGRGSVINGAYPV